jgi:hypothetical protein
LAFFTIWMLPGCGGGGCCVSWKVHSTDVPGPIVIATWLPVIVTASSGLQETSSSVQPSGTISLTVYVPGGRSVKRRDCDPPATLSTSVKSSRGGEGEALKGNSCAPCGLAFFSISIVPGSARLSTVHVTIALKPMSSRVKVGDDNGILARRRPTLLTVHPDPSLTNSYPCCVVSESVTVLFALLSFGVHSNVAVPSASVVLLRVVGGGTPGFGCTHT